MGFTHASSAILDSDVERLVVEGYAHGELTEQPHGLGVRTRTTSLQFLECPGE
jgi:hypothetical protein